MKQAPMAIPTERGVVSALLVSLLCGCTTLPAFTGPPGLSVAASSQAPAGPVPTVADVIEHIQCEIWSLPKPPPEGQAETADQKVFDRLWKYQYVVYAILNVDVTDDGQVDPSLSFIKPLTAAATSRSISLSPNFAGAAHRNIAQTFVLDLDPAGNPTFDTGKSPDGEQLTVEQYCAKRESGRFGIEGDLGIRDIVAEGLRHTGNSDFLFPLPIPSDQVDKLGIASAAPSFGSTIDFTLTYGLGGGPNWTLTHFNGPTGSNPLLNYTRTRKDTLVLSFAAAGQRQIGATAESKSLSNAAAAAAARESATLNLLQHILPAVR